MRILIYGINYAPELTGIGKYTAEMAAWLAKQGHEVHVLTAMPYYPEWEIHKKYKGKLWFVEDIDAVKVHRVPLYVPKKVSSVKRIIHEFSFLLSCLPFWLKFLFSKKYDVVFSISPPFHLGFFAVLYKMIKSSMLVTHVQDLQVDAAKDLGMIKNEKFLNLMFSGEKWLLDKSTLVSTISEGMNGRIIAKGITYDKMLFFPNWVDSKIVYPLAKEQSLLSDLGFLLDDRIVLYSGNLGEKQGLDAIVRAAKHFETQPEIKFVICGSGGAKEKLVELVNKSNLLNVFFFPLQPYEKLSALLAMADLHLVLQKGGAADLVMPSKLTGILAAGGCALVTALPGTSLYEVITANEMGIIVAPEDDLALFKGIREGLFGDVIKYKSNARSYAERYLDKDKILRNLELSLVKRTGSAQY